MEKTSSAQIERLIARSDWARARSLIQRELRANRKNHWLLARLALTHYEQRNYQRALDVEVKGLQIAPERPLLCWGYAGSSSMLGKNKEALAVYEWLIERGIDDLAYGQCGEGRAWARGLIADAYYRSALCHQDLGDRARALSALRKHLRMRGPGCRSIYPIQEVRELVERLRRNNQKSKKRKSGPRRPLKA